MPALADALPPLPVHSNICTTADPGGIVDKDKFADYLLKANPLNARLVEFPADASLSGVSISRQMLARLLASPAKCDNCTDTDKANLAQIAGIIDSIGAGNEAASYRPTTGVSPDTYFQGKSQDHAIVCVTDSSGKPIEAPGAIARSPQKTDSQWRIRGVVNDLWIDRSATQDFQGTSKATIDFTQDGVAHKRTDKMTAAVGYHFDLVQSKGELSPKLDLIPYVATNRNVVNILPGGTGKPSAAETADVGALFNGYWLSQLPSSYMGHIVNIRPDLLVNTQDNSKIFSANLQYMPVWHIGLNSFNPLITGTDFVSYKFIFDLRDDNGVYTSKGTTKADASNRNFVRLGGQAGLALISDMPNLPISLTSTYTGLYGVSGKKNIGYFLNSLTFYLDPNKYFGITASYSNGVREDTAIREQLWEIAFSAHF